MDFKSLDDSINKIRGNTKDNTNIGATILGAIAIIIGAIFTFLGIVAFMTILQGFVLCKLWMWFIVPFFGLPIMSLPYAIGIALVFDVLKKNIAKKDVEINWWQTLLNPLILLLMGYIVKLFI
jgi:hypothetical protein